MANTMTSFKAKMLWDSISRGDLSSVHSMLENGHINLEERDQNGCTFLMTASESGDIQIVRELLQIGVDPNAVDNENWSALLCACKQGHLEVVIELLEHNADIEHTDMCGWTSLMWACYKGRTQVVSELLERGANSNVKADHNMTCISWAAGRGHLEIAQMLIDKGAKINMPDKYGTTPLIWACRKGHADIVEALLGEGASSDASGMNSWTPLLVATKGGHAEVVRSLLTQGPNVNATDKDGLTALGIAAKEGFSEIVNDLMSKGAYVNMQDRNGDSILIHAVKGGHVDVVKSLLKKYVDADVAGQDGKTSIYWAVEKGYTEIVRLLLNSNPDLEISTKDEDTPLLRSVRSRNEECVRLLLEKGAKVSAHDKRGDTALHISIRARSKRITELLLRNPRHSRLLYRLNKAGESPYSMDTYHQRGILPQIYGHGNLNATDAENLLGYEIYSSALADILSEPGLITPLTLGLYAKWGSGKSFLLDKLTSEMKVFTQQNKQTELTWSWVTAFLILLFNCVLGEGLGLAFGWQVGVGVALGLLPFQYGFIGLIILLTSKYDFNMIDHLSAALGRKQRLLVLMMQMLFCLPKTKTVSKDKAVGTFSVRFLFSESTRLTSVGGEKSLAAMIGTLCDAVEKEYGVFITRLFRVFKLDAAKRSSMSVYKSICCIPYFLLVLFILACILVGAGLAIHFGIEKSVAVDSVLIGLVCVVALAVVANLYTWGQMAMALVFSQKRRVLKAADSGSGGGGDVRMEGLMQQLKKEIDLMSRMVNTMDGFTTDQTRLVVIVDGLDSCEQNKVLQVLDTVKSLFSDDGSPFVTVLAVDPHIIIKGIEQNLRSSYQDTNVNGFDYLRNVVHLPFYLQSQGIRIQHVEHTSTNAYQHQGSTGDGETPHRPQRVVSHDSSAGERLVPGSSSTSHHKNVRGIGSSTARIGGSVSGSLPGIIYASSFDLANTFVRSDYFSDINPRSMRRLMNIVAVTARLLRAYNIEFKWQRLAAWINLTEQWPYRLSWVITAFEEADHLDNNVSLYSLYERVVSSIPATKEQDPLLEIDRNVRKLEAFLTSRSGNFPQLGVADLRKFLPCTTNLDPYLRKLIRENRYNLERQQAEMATMAGIFPPPAPPAPPPPGSAGNTGSLLRDSVPPGDRLGPGNLSTTPTRFGMSTVASHPFLYGMYAAAAAQQPSFPYPAGLQHSHLMNSFAQLQQQQQQQQQQQKQNQQQTNVASNKVNSAQNPRDFFKDLPAAVCLSKLSVEEVCDLVSRLKGLSPDHLQRYQSSIRDNNVSGLVITMCDISELQPIINMKFGDWQLFRSAVNTLKDFEKENASLRISCSVPVVSSSSSSSNGSSSNSYSSSNKSQTYTSGAMDFKDIVRERSNTPERGVFTKGGGQKVVPPAKLLRKDSILQQMSFETAILKSAVSEFMEESEEEEEEEEDEEVVIDMEGEKSDKPSLFKVGSEGSVNSDSEPRQDTLSGVTLQSTSSITNTTSNLPQSSASNLGTTKSLSGTEESKGGRSNTLTLSDNDVSSSQGVNPISLSDIGSFIKVLDEPKRPAYGSSEFVPLLGKSHSLSSSSDLVVTSSSSLSKPIDQSLEAVGSASSSGHIVSTHQAQIEIHSGGQRSFSPQRDSLDSTNRQMPVLQQLHKQSRVASTSPSPTRETGSLGDSYKSISSSGSKESSNVDVHRSTSLKSDSGRFGGHPSTSHSKDSSLSSPSQHHHLPHSSHHPPTLPVTSHHHDHQHQTLMDRSKSTVVEMWSSDAESRSRSNSLFHSRLGQAFDDLDLAGASNSQPSHQQHQHQQSDQVMVASGAGGVQGDSLCPDDDKETKI